VKKIFINNASAKSIVAVGDFPNGESIKEPWLKRNKFRVLFGIIGILVVCLLGTIDSLTKTEQRLKQRTENLRWLAFEHQKIRNERDFYSKLTKDYEYYKFVKTIYEHKDKDFFETITIAYEESLRQNISPWDTMSIMWVESGIQQFVVSQIKKIVDGEIVTKPCAYGFMQVNYNAWKEEKGLTLDNIFDKKTNIRVGLEIYKYYLRLASQSTSDPKEQKKLALFYYNNGTDPQIPNYNYAPTVLSSKFMKMANGYQLINTTYAQTDTSR